MAEGGAAIEMECGFCLRKDGNLEDPRSLPCAHVHCLQCLIGDLGVNGIVRCPFCREVFDVDLSTLPTSNAGEHTSRPPCCDACTREGVTNLPAVIYCTTCSSKLCNKHEEVHAGLHGAHPLITMMEYRAQAWKLEPRPCTEHKELAYSSGCRRCLSVLCTQCLVGVDVCTDGSAHELLPLNELIAELSKEVDKLRSEIYEREDKLSALFKHTSRVICEYDCETKDMIYTLHKKRDEQLRDIQRKYEKLEKELLELRANVKSELSRFMEQDVGVKLCDLSKHRLRIEARIKHNHQVDVINKHEETVDEIKKLISVELPTLEIQNMATLRLNNELREIEAEVSVSQHGVVDFEHGLTTGEPLPRHMILLHTVHALNSNISVCGHEGDTYVGLWNGRIYKIDGNYQLSEPVVRFDGRVLGANSIYGVTIYKGRMYCLVYGTPFKVCVFDLAGQLITSWIHEDRVETFSKLTIVDDLVIIPDRQNERITVYSLTGEVVKYIPCPLLGTHWVFLCAADDHSFVVSVYDASRLFKVNLANGEVIWTCEQVDRPQGVAYHGGRVFVSPGGNTTRVCILDGKTGELLREISDLTARSNTHTLDLHVSGSSLIVPRWSESTVLFYQLD